MIVLLGQYVIMKEMKFQMCWNLLQVGNEKGYSLAEILVNEKQVLEDFLYVSVHLIWISE